MVFYEIRAAPHGYSRRSILRVVVVQVLAEDSNVITSFGKVRCEEKLFGPGVMLSAVHARLVARVWHFDIVEVTRRKELSAAGTAHGGVHEPILSCGSLSRESG
jgi:hypothetical protein